jgi:hypothetical protein
LTISQRHHEEANQLIIKIIYIILSENFFGKIFFGNFFLDFFVKTLSEY